MVSVVSVAAAVRRNSAGEANFVFAAGAVIVTTGWANTFAASSNTSVTDNFFNTIPLCLQSPLAEWLQCPVNGPDAGRDRRSYRWVKRTDRIRHRPSVADYHSLCPRG